MKIIIISSTSGRNHYDNNSLINKHIDCKLFVINIVDDDDVYAHNNSNCNNNNNY